MVRAELLLPASTSVQGSRALYLGLVFMSLVQTCGQIRLCVGRGGGEALAFVFVFLLGGRRRCLGSVGSLRMQVIGGGD